MVIDDGSSDNTIDIIEQYLIDNNGFEIQYFKTKNGGKHRAINFAANKLNSDYVVIIDSDDFLRNDAVQIMLDAWVQHEKDLKIGELVFERGKSNISDPMVSLTNYKGRANRFQFMIKNKLFGDFTDVFRSEVLRAYPLPEFEGENFISESPLYFESSRDYDSVFFDQVVSIGDYREGGLTSDLWKNRFANPNGAYLDAKLGLIFKGPLFYLFKKGIIYNAMASELDIPLLESLKQTQHKWIVIGTYGFGLLFRRKYKWGKFVWNN